MNVHHLDRTELLRNIAHAFRVPLGSIFNLTDLLRLGLEGELDAQACETVTSINADAHQLHHTVEAIFELIQSDRSTLNDRPVDLVALVSEVADQLNEQAKQFGKSVTISSIDSVPFVDADAEILRQVLLKLLSHAMQFTQQDTISVGMDIETDHVVVAIGDNPSDAISGLPDTQLTDDLSIGLLFCLNAIERYRGTLWASHSEAGGCVLRFSLLLAAPQNTPQK